MTTATELMMFEVKRVCGYITDDGTVAAYFRIPREVVANVRETLPTPRQIHGGEERYGDGSKNSSSGLNAFTEDCEKARIGSMMLKQALDNMFARWEDDNGFCAGAGVELLPRGWSDNLQSAAA